MTLFLWYTVDGVGCWGGTQRVGWDGFQWGARCFSAKVNKEMSYHTICCLWSVTHGFWRAASTLPACLSACLTDNGQTLNNSSCHLRKYTQREAVDMSCMSDKTFSDIPAAEWSNRSWVKVTSNTQQTTGCVLDSVTEALHQFLTFYCTLKMLQIITATGDTCTPHCI